MGTPKHWKHMCFEKGDVFFEKKKAPARNARNLVRVASFSGKKKAPARNARHRRPLGYQIINHPEKFKLVFGLSEQFWVGDRCCVWLCLLKLFSSHQIRHFQEIVDLVLPSLFSHQIRHFQEIVDVVLPIVQIQPRLMYT